MTATYTLDDFDFDFALPPELIAQHPTPERSASRLLDAQGTAPVDLIFRELPALLREGDLLVFNDTRVIKARLLGVKDSGGAVEALVERVLPGHEVLAHLRASKTSRAGSVLRFAGAFDAEVLGRAPAPHESLYRLRLPEDPLHLLERHGQVPLPPYIRHAPDAADEQRYQTVFARNPGAVAAPTAALHFDAPLLREIAARGVATAYVTLHVGAGTFQPVRSSNLAEHRMHREWFDVGAGVVQAVQAARQRGARVVAVGTTSLRALESAARGGTLAACRGDTDLFITPGFEFRVVDALITNFHLPRSTLMMLVGAFAGLERVRALYAHAVAQRYRFFSYGDSMWLSRLRDAPGA
jgi:S-adenosylmethionine:tRNA ribosyltransferase-isomerase